MPKEKKVKKEKKEKAPLTKKKKILIVLVALLLVAAAAAYILLIRGIGEDTYKIGKDTVRAFPLEEGGSLAEEVKTEANSEEEIEESYAYTYEGLEHGGVAVGNYVALLTTEGAGFTVVNRNGQPAQSPDFLEEEGTVYLSGPSAAEGKVCSMAIDWTETGCVIALTHQTEGNEEEKTQELTMHGAVEYLENFPPTLLGLDGVSMSEYIIYPKPGTILVDGEGCMELDVYDSSPVSTNTLVGSFLLKGDNTLYRLDQETGEVTQVEGLEEYTKQFTPSE